MKILRWATLCLTSLLLCLWLGSCSAASPQVVSLNFGAAGMTRSALEEIGKLYEYEHPNVVLHYVFAGTRVIKEAVERGELFDGILLADVLPIDELEAKGFILPESRKELVSTDIVAIAPKNAAAQLSDFREVASDRIKTVAIGGKELAVGKYTQEILNQLGIAQVVKSKAIVAKADVREVLLTVERGEAEVGITFLPEAKTSTKVKVIATAATNLYQPIRSGVAVVKTSAHPQAMQSYLDFLSSDRAREVFQKFGLRPLMSSVTRMVGGHDGTII